MEERDPRDDAVALLARREYSRAELRERLLRKGHDDDTIERTLSSLQEENLQSDARFAEHFVHSRIMRLQGPRKVEAELRQRGVDNALIAHALSAAGADWFELACQALARRFDGPGSDMKVRAKRLRFLASRGFDGEQSRHALEHAWQER